MYRIKDKGTKVIIAAKITIEEINKDAYNLFIKTTFSRSQQYLQIKSSVNS